MSNVFHYYIFCSKNTSITTKKVIGFLKEAEFSGVVFVVSSLPVVVVVSSTLVVVSASSVVTSESSNSNQIDKSQ